MNIYHRYFNTSCLKATTTSSQRPDRMASNNGSRGATRKNTHDVRTGGNQMDGPNTEGGQNYYGLNATERLRAVGLATGTRGALAAGGAVAAGTVAGEDVRMSGTSSTSGEEDRGEQGPGQYEPVEFEADKAGYVGEIVQDSGVVTNESRTASFHLTSAMHALNLAKNALRRSNEGAAKMAKAAEREIKRRKYIAANVGEEANRMFEEHALEIEGRGRPGVRREGHEVAMSMLNEIGRLRYEAIEARTRARGVKYELELRNAEIKRWTEEYGTTVREFTYRVQQANEACGGSWPERFPIVELPEAVKKMNLAVEVLRWLTRSDAGSEDAGAVAAATGTEEGEGPRTPPWKPPTTGNESNGARGGVGGVKYLGPMRKVKKDDSTEEDSWDEDDKTKADFGVPE